MVTAMTALWFGHLDAHDKVAVKPHASPVFHAIQYLLGELDRVLPHHPARTGRPPVLPEPDEGPRRGGLLHRLGRARRRVAAVRRCRTALRRRPLRQPDASRFIAFVGDAELDEGNIWEAIFDAATAGLGNTMWVVDFNRQSLDRVVPGVRIDQWRGQFESAGWHVVEVKYGARLQAAFARPGGSALRGWLDAMPNEHYQSMFGLAGDALRKPAARGCAGRRRGRSSTRSWTTTCRARHGSRRAQCRGDAGGVRRVRPVEDRPSVVFAYTIKGWGLPDRGQPAQPLGAAHHRADRRAAVRPWASSGRTSGTVSTRHSPAGSCADQRREALRREPREPRLDHEIPSETGVRSSEAAVDAGGVRAGPRRPLAQRRALRRTS